MIHNRKPKAKSSHMLTSVNPQSPNARSIFYGERAAPAIICHFLMDIDSFFEVNFDTTIPHGLLSNEGSDLFIPAKNP